MEMSIISKFKDFFDVFKSSGIEGLRNNIKYEISKTDEEIEQRKKIINQTKEYIKIRKSTRK